MAVDDHFSLFGLPNTYALDESALSAAWRDVAGRVHPDRFATASAPERRVAMQWSARANEAYRTLRDPLLRARYMCEQAGVDLQTETNTAMSPTFLMQQMAWREQLDDARALREAAAFDALDADLRDAQAVLARDIGESIDARHDFDQAGQRVREWMFIQRIAQSLDEHRSR